MGNIERINRHGLLDNNQYGTIDSVQIWYIGNQMVHADDAVAGPSYAGAFHFRDGSGTQPDTEYTYDENGRMTKDFNKNILSIQYNLLNLPSRTTFGDGGYINYQYSASGMKQMVSGYAPGQGYKSQFYIGNYVYGNGVKQLLVDGGYVTFSGTTPQYHFYVKDHLGNNRMVVNASGTVEQVNHYYAFGALMGESTGGDVQDFKYNGKELDRLHGLDWFDYGARHYDGVIGSWPTMDPLCEKYHDISPYVYCKNNPIRYIDPDGRLVVFAKSTSNTFRNNFSKAVRYLSSHGCGGMLKALNDSKQTYYISESTCGSNSFDYKTRVISWDSQVGLKTNDEHYLSPTTLLNHEVDHALEFDKSPDTYKENIKQYGDSDIDSFYYSPEEKRVITGSEQKTAKALGEIKDNEVTRTDHFGKHILMKSTTSNKPLKEEKEVIVYPQKNNM